MSKLSTANLETDSKYSNIDTNVIDGMSAVIDVLAEPLWDRIVLNAKVRMQ